MGQSSGVLFKEVSAFQRRPLTEVYCIICNVWYIYIFKAWGLEGL